MIVVLVNNIFLALASFVPRGRGIKEEAPLSDGEEDDEPIQGIRRVSSPAWPGPRGRGLARQTEALAQLESHHECIGFS